MKCKNSGTDGWFGSEDGRMWKPEFNSEGNARSARFAKLFLFIYLFFFES